MQNNGLISAWSLTNTLSHFGLNNVSRSETIVQDHIWLIEVSHSFLHDDSAEWRFYRLSINRYNVDFTESFFHFLDFGIDCLARLRCLRVCHWSVISCRRLNLVIWRDDNLIDSIDFGKGLSAEMLGVYLSSVSICTLTRLKLVKRADK